MSYLEIVCALVALVAVAGFAYILLGYRKRLDQHLLEECKTAGFVPVISKERVDEEPLVESQLAIDTEPQSDQVNILTPKPSCNPVLSTETEIDMKTTTNMICTIAQAQALLDARRYTKGTRAHKDAQLPIMRQIKKDHGLPPSTKLKIWIANPENELYRVLRDKRTGMPLVGPVRQLTLGEAGFVAPKKVVVKKVAAKPATKKVPAKKVAAKPATKKVAAVKAPVGTVAKFVKGKPVAASKASPVKTATHQVLMRVSINGKKQQLGYASSPEAAAKIVAAARKAAA